MLIHTRQSLDGVKWESKSREEKTKGYVPSFSFSSHRCPEPPLFQTGEGKVSNMCPGLEVEDIARFKGQLLISQSSSHRKALHKKGEKHMKRKTFAIAALYFQRTSSVQRRYIQEFG